MLHENNFAEIAVDNVEYSSKNKIRNSSTKYLRVAIGKNAKRQKCEY